MIVVDGNSTDDTVGVAKRLRPDLTVIHQTRGGKGNALACGFAAATGDFIVMIDADGSNDPAEIPRFITALKEGADFAKGSRFLSGGGSLDISLIRRCGNFWLNKVVNLIYGTHYTDLCYGYNAFRRACLDVMRLNAPDIEGSEPGVMLWGDGFEVETLINVRSPRPVSGFRRFRVSSPAVTTARATSTPSQTACECCGPSTPRARVAGRCRNIQALRTQDGGFVGIVVHAQRRGCVTREGCSDDDQDIGASRFRRRPVDAWSSGEETHKGRSRAGEAVDAVVTQTSERSSSPEASALRSTNSRNRSGPNSGGIRHDSVCGRLYPLVGSLIPHLWRM